MSLLPFSLDQRRVETAPGTSLGAIADSLAADLAPWLHEPLPVPVTKARLTRIGGRCPQHGVLLDFDPHAPFAHRCPVCHTVFTEPEHHEWWAMGAHLFTAERTVHAAALYALRGDDRHRALAVHTLERLAQQYAHWPNRDNALGPTRPFFSTYLESIWLLNLSHAVALLERAGERTVGAIVREHVLAPSSALIATFHEGRSNRQVWNEVAILSAWTLLGRHDDVTARLDAPGSLLTLLNDGLLADGTWYEGENYHQFAHRGLWYGVQLLDALDYPLSTELRSRFHEGFATPFAALLPDETLPARRDSQYAVSVRQWRWAEWCELGYACTADERLAATLQRLYDGTAPVGDTGRARSTADAERNRPATALSRADCNWRALLMANAQPVPPASWSPASVLQSRQGLALLRRDRGRVYVALEGGEQGGGHGHPDRLSLTLQRNATRVLDDPGTGSYVERTLHWYRSTLAHHAPLVNGASQQPGHTQLTAFEDRGGAGWMQKVARELAPGVIGTRTVVVCDGYLVDVFEFTAERPVTVTLPVASNVTTNVTDWRPTERHGAGGLEDGFDFLSHVEAAHEVPDTVTLSLAGAPSVAAHYAVHAHAATDDSSVESSALWWRATAPGAPTRPLQQRVMVDMHGTHGRCVGVWTFTESSEASVIPTNAVTDVALAPRGPVLANVSTADGTTASHEPAAHGWHIGLVARHSRSSIDLEWLPGSFANAPETSHADADIFRTFPLRTVSVPAVSRADELRTSACTFTLARESYVQTEEPWGDRNAPEAFVQLAHTGTELLVRVDVHTGHAPPVVHGDRDRMPDNPLDNERADTNADGLQCYLGTSGDTLGTWRAAVLLVPLGDGEARVTSLVTGGALPQVRVTSTESGWSATLRWALSALPAAPLTFDLVVNERPAARERRRGQLVLSGGGGFGYLRGDRHRPAHPVGLVLA